jgi:hypothetical protein
MPKRIESAIVAVFRNISDAQAAAGELTANAFAGDHIHLASENNKAVPAIDPPQSREAGHLEKNVESWCEATFGQNQKIERDRFENVVRGGNALLGLDTPEQMMDTAAEILNHHSPVDLARHGTAVSSAETNVVAKTADRRDLQKAAGANERLILGPSLRELYI